MPVRLVYNAQLMVVPGAVTQRILVNPHECTLQWYNPAVAQQSPEQSNWYQPINSAEPVHRPQYRPSVPPWLQKNKMPAPAAFHQQSLKPPHNAMGHSVNFQNTIGGYTEQSGQFNRYSPHSSSESFHPIYQTSNVFPIQCNGLHNHSGVRFQVEPRHQLVRQTAEKCMQTQQFEHCNYRSSNMDMPQNIQVLAQNNNKQITKNFGQDKGGDTNEQTNVQCSLTAVTPESTFKGPHVDGLIKETEEEERRKERFGGIVLVNKQDHNFKKPISKISEKDAVKSTTEIYKLNKGNENKEILTSTLGEELCIYEKVHNVEIPILENSESVAVKVETDICINIDTSLNNGNDRNESCTSMLGEKVYINELDHKFEIDGYELVKVETDNIRKINSVSKTGEATTEKERMDNSEVGEIILEKENVKRKLAKRNKASVKQKSSEDLSNENNDTGTSPNESITALKNVSDEFNKKITNKTAIKNKANCDSIGHSGILNHIIDGIIISESNLPFKVKGVTSLSLDKETVKGNAINQNKEPNNMTRRLSPLKQLNMNERQLTISHERQTHIEKELANEHPSRNIVLNHVIDGLIIQESDVPFSPFSKDYEYRRRQKEMESNVSTHVQQTDADTLNGDAISTGPDVGIAPVDADTLQSWSCSELQRHLSAAWCPCMWQLAEHSVDGASLQLAAAYQLREAGVCDAHARALCVFATGSEDGATAAGLQDVATC